MIQGDQPTCFPENLFVAVSSKKDGTVLDRAAGVYTPEVITNRTRFCDAVGISYGDAAYQRIIYDDSQTYDHIVQVTEGDTTKYASEVQADALITETPGVGLFLPVADCVATVVYDASKRRLAMLHLGRHSTLADLMTKVLAEYVRLGSDLKDVTIWMAPSVQKAHYALDYFTAKDQPAWQEFYEERDGKIYIDMQGYNRYAAITAGVPATQIVVSPIDTAVDENYFSHSQGDTAGRFAVLAVMRV